MQQGHLKALWRCVLAMCMSAFVGARASETPGPQRLLSLSECIQIALQHNIDVKIARFEPEIERHYLAGAQSAYEPVLNLAGTHESSRTRSGADSQSRGLPGTRSEGNSYSAGITGLLPTGLQFDLGGDLSGASGLDSSGPFKSVSGATSIRLRQPLLKDFWIDSTRLNILVRKKQLGISEQALRLEIINIITGVELAYYDLLLARGRMKVQEQAVQLAERLAKETAKRVSVGTMARLDEKQAESQVSARKADLLGAQGAVIAREYELKNLLSDDFPEWAGTRINPSGNLDVAPKPFNLQDSWRRGLSLRPELLQMKLDLERQGVVLKYLRNQIFPQLDIVGSYGLRGSDRSYGGALEGIRSGDSASYSIGVVLSIPMGGNRVARESYRAGRAELNQSLLRLKKLEQDVMVQIGIAIEEARTRFAQVNATRQSRHFAESALEAAQRKLENGKSTSFEVLILQRDLTAAQLAELAALADYNRALARLALREGSTLERHRWTVTIK